MHILDISNQIVAEPPANRLIAPGSTLLMVTEDAGDDCNDPNTVFLPTLVTAGVLSRMTQLNPKVHMPFLAEARRRYQNGDYGSTAERYPDDAEINRQSLREKQGSIMATYADPEGNQIRIGQTLPAEPIPVIFLPEEH